MALKKRGLFVILQHREVARLQEVARETVCAEVLMVPGLGVRKWHTSQARRTVPATVLALDGLV